MSENADENLKQTFVGVQEFTGSSFCVAAAETSVQQASKQVQVDLQDLGYETCGRSENEAEREDTSSPGNSKIKIPLKQ